jgi:hypothetical protein
MNDHTGIEDAESYDPFIHLYPILLGTEKGFVEIVLAFVIVKGEGDFDRMGTAIQLEPGDHVDLPVETKKRFEIPDDFFSGQARTTTNSGFWILPAIISARRLIGPPEENMPGGEGGEPISPVELGEIMVNVDFSEIFTEFRECIIESKFVPKRLIGIIDRFIEKYQS